MADWTGAFEKRYDVIVAGAGVAGVAAALECARAGLKTALLEKTVLPGGLATTGLVNVYLPLCDGAGRQVIFGIAEELLRLSLKYGPGQIPPGWNGDGSVPSQRFRAVFSPASCILALDEALEEAGVHIWFDTLIVGTRMEGEWVRAVEVANKSGLGVLFGRCIVDATGDADVAAFSGAPCVEEGNWPSLWTLAASLESAKKAVRDDDGEALLQKMVFHSRRPDRNESIVTRQMRGTDGREVSEFVLASRLMLRKRMQRHLREHGEQARSTLYPVALPAMALFRRTRRIDGFDSLSDGQHGQRREDSIGLTGDWRSGHDGEVWEIPYGCLIPRQVKGLVVAGRCISSGGDAWEVTRVIPTAALTGQAAGIAATLSVRKGASPGDLEAGAVQAAARGRGIAIHIDDLRQ